MTTAQLSLLEDIPTGRFGQPPRAKPTSPADNAATLAAEVAAAGPRPARLPVTERLAAVARDATLADIVARASAWDRFVVEQAVYAFGRERGEFSANDLREVLPETGRGFLGAAIGALRGSGVIEHTGRMVPSTSGPTKGHGIHVWRLSARGRRLAGRSAAATLEAA